MKTRAGNAYLRAFLGAGLFGISAPLLSKLDWGAPRLMAALVYGGFGIPFFLIYRPWRDPVAKGERRWLATSLLAGGVLAPLLLMLGLQTVPGAAAPLWLGAEPVFTVLLGVLVFHEPSSRRLWLSLGLLLAGAVALSDAGGAWPGILALLSAAAAWGVDNQASANIVSIRPETLSAWKGLVGLAINGALGLFLYGESLPANPSVILGIAVTGLICYGVSLLLVLQAMRVLGGSRASIAFSLSPVLGALTGLALGMYTGSLWLLLAASVLIGLAGYVLFSEQHAHEHAHDALEHSHEHVHDEHHQHEHAPGTPPGEPHTHPHRHVPLRHAHPHVADVHHRHH